MCVFVCASQVGLWKGAHHLLNSSTTPIMTLTSLQRPGHAAAKEPQLSTPLVVKSGVSEARHWEPRLRCANRGDSASIGDHTRSS